MTSKGNKAPTLKWWHFDLGPVTRQRLYVNGTETPYFIDTAKEHAHRIYGEKHGLFGAGMDPKGIAATLDFGPRIAVLKHRAEQMAFTA